MGVSRQRSAKGYKADIVKEAIMRHRLRMTRARYKREFATVYKSSKCAVCGNLAWGGVICSKKRGAVCQKHCYECCCFEPQFYKCTYQETEPIDMKSWQRICSAADLEELARHMDYCLSYGAMLAAKEKPTDEDKSRAANLAREMAYMREKPKYIIEATADEDGNHGVIDSDNGRRAAVFVVYLPEVKMWTAVRYF